MNSLSDYAHCAEILADAPGTRFPVVGIVNYSAIDSGLNPDGPHLVSVTGLDRTANWEGLDEAAYRAKRDRWLDAIVAEIDRSFPGFAAAVVQREMATAATMRRYLNTPGGAVYGYAARAAQRPADARLRKGRRDDRRGFVAGVGLRRGRRLHRNHADGNAGGAGRHEVAT